MIKIACTFVIIWAFSSVGYGQHHALCDSYIEKIGGQLNACGANPHCLRSAFIHPLNPKNYGNKFQHCQGRFASEVASRTGSQPSAGLLQSVAGAQDAAVPKSAIEDPNAQMSPEALAQGEPAQCPKARRFFRYASQSCKSSGCVRRQYRNTLNISEFKGCQEHMGQLLETIAAQPPGYNPAAGPWQYEYQKGKNAQQPKMSH